MNKSQSSRKPESSAKAQDAVALLKADHRQVEAWFEEFEASNRKATKKKLADQICQALTVHTQIEEEIFYPAFIEATQDEDLHHEAIVEHDGVYVDEDGFFASSPDVQDTHWKYIPV